MEEYCYIDTISVDLNLKVDLFDEIQASEEQQKKFDDVVVKMDKIICEQTQVICDKVFGEGVVYVD